MPVKAATLSSVMMTPVAVARRVFAESARTSRSLNTERFSNPVSAPDAVYVLGLKGRQPPRVPAFEEVADRLVATRLQLLNVFDTPGA